MSPQEATMLCILAKTTGSAFGQRSSRLSESFVNFNLRTLVLPVFPEDVFPGSLLSKEQYFIEFFYMVPMGVCLSPLI